MTDRDVAKKYLRANHAGEAGIVLAASVHVSLCVSVCEKKTEKLLINT